MSRAPQTMGFTELKEWLRHRHPMVLLDRILDYENGKFLKGLSVVSGSDPTIAGHFPERAVYPGTQMAQIFSQCSIILYQLSTSKLEEDEMTVVASLESRFFKVVVPGDTMIFDVELERESNGMCFFKARTTVNDERVAAFRCSLVRRSIDKFGQPLW